MLKGVGVRLPPPVPISRGKSRNPGCICIMRVLVLDDMNTRHKWFITALIGHNYHPVYSSESAIEELQKFKFDMIFLDHDLEEQHYNVWTGAELDDEAFFSRLERTGYDVTKWMVENNNHKQAQVIVHSLNPAGSKRMVDLLTSNGYNAKYVSFLELQKRLINNER